MTNNGICIIEGCGREVKPEGGTHGSCGLCNACAVASCVAVKIGKVTREQLVEMGLMLPKAPARGGRLGPRSSPFSVALAKALEGK